jgi:hypothetical protein
MFDASRSHRSSENKNYMSIYLRLPEDGSIAVFRNVVHVKGACDALYDLQ